MTGREVLMAAAGLLGESEDGMRYYEQFALVYLNQLLADCLRETNALRVRDGLDELRVPLQMQSLEQEVPGEEAMIRECFPYGFAALCICDDDREKFNWLSAEFSARLDLHCPAAQFAIEELY